MTGRGTGFGVEAHAGWLRLDHEGLALPLPSVYLPADDLYQRDLTALGFGSALEAAGGGTFPMSRHVLGDVTDPDRLGLFVSRRELWSVGGGEVEVSEDQETKYIDGRYTEPAERVWQRSAQKARRIIVVAGPRPAVPGSGGITDPLELLASRETLVGLLFSPTTMLAAVALATRRA